MTCPVAIRWGTMPDSVTRCDKEDGHPLGEGHEGPGLAEFPHQRVHWLAGDRREYMGEWPGPCQDQPCLLPAGHRGNHAP